MANRVNASQSSLIRVCTVCICQLIRNIGVPNFRTFTVLLFYQNNSLTFHANSPKGQFALHPKETVCMKCQTIF